MGMIDRIRSVVGGKAADLTPARPKSEFFRRDASPFMATWKPRLRDQQEDVRAAWQDSAARSIDAMQNSGFIAGIIEASTGAVVGAGLRLAAQPETKLLGWTESTASEWAKDVEAKFSAWANSPMDCDASGKLTFGQQQQIAYVSYLTFGEVLAMQPIVQRSANAVSKTLLLPPTRLMQRDDPMRRVVSGVEVDTFGMPTGYYFEIFDKFMRDEKRVGARDRGGRRNVIHLTTPGLGTVRGISPLASALKTVRQLDQYCDATLTAALLQTIFAATIKTEATGAAAFEGLMTEGEQNQGTLDLDLLAKAKADWYDESKVDLFTHGRIAHLFPNDTLEFHKAEHPGTQFDMVMQWLSREIARAAGVTYETATGDSRNATYSSVRMSTSENWNIVTMRRTHGPIPFCQQTYETWLEDSIGIGYVQFPGGLNGFREKKAAACGARWDGPAKPQADDLKTAKANETLYRLGVNTLQSICAEYGSDWETVIEQRAREREFAMKLGLPDPYINAGVLQPPLPEGTETEPEDKEEAA
jgi:lambda family phage portal protein